MSVPTMEEYRRECLSSGLSPLCGLGRFLTLLSRLPSCAFTPRRLIGLRRGPSLTAETIRDQHDHVRESWVKAMEARLLRAELEKCYKGEGVNHYKNCRDLAERYIEMIRENKVGLSVHAQRVRDILVVPAWVSPLYPCMGCAASGSPLGVV